MTLAPRLLVSFLAGLRVARLKRRLRGAGDGLAGQRRAFRHLTGQLAGTAFGREHRLEAGMDYVRFRAAVPLRTIEQFQPYVARMMAGEAGVLWPGDCRLYVETAGTTTGTPQRLPVTGEQLEHYRAGLAATVLLLAARTGHTGLFLGRHLHAGGSVDLVEAGRNHTGSLEAFTHFALSPWTEANLYAPPAPVAVLPEGAARTEQTVERMLRRDVTVLVGNPAALHALAEAVRRKASAPKRVVHHLTAVWPNLEGVIHTGAAPGLLGGELRAMAGPSVLQHELYAAAEGYFAAQESDASAGLRLLTELGVFFEFLPWAGFSEGGLAVAGSRCVGLDQVRPGVDYVLVVTTPAGLCRAVTGDIVRFLETEPPRLQFVGRTRHRLEAFDEQIGERELTDALLEVCAAQGWSPVCFHVAPLAHRLAPPAHGGHEWWIELRSGTVRTPTGPLLAEELDAALARRNADYAARRADQRLAPPVVRLVMPGTFERWRAEHWPGCSPAKLPRCRSDRAIADGLMGLARFHAGTEPVPLVASVAGTRHPFAGRPAPGGSRPPLG